MPHDGMRTTIAQRLTASMQTIPHFYLTLDCDIGKLMAAREEINAAAPKDKDGKPAYKLSVNDFVIKALALALQRMPDANVSWTEGGMLKHKHSDVGVAVAMPGGLITPIMRNAETQVAVGDLQRDARIWPPAPAPASSSRMNIRAAPPSVSNLGMYGIKDFTAVINPPQVDHPGGRRGRGARRGRATARSRRRTIMTRDAVLRSPRGRWRARRRADRRLQDADRKSGDDGRVS